MKLLAESIEGKEKELALIQLFYLFILPPFLLYIGVIPSTWRMVLLLGISLIIGGIIRKEHWGLDRLGFRSVTKKSFLFYLIFTIAGVIVLRIFADIFEVSVIPVQWWRQTELVLFFLPVSFLQEFVFRGVLVPLSFQLFSDRKLVVMLNVLLFAFIHIIYPPLALSIPIAIFAGLAFVLAYLKHPNMLLITFSHAVLNFLAVGYGFFNV